MAREDVEQGRAPAQGAPGAEEVDPGRVEALFEATRARVLAQATTPLSTYRVQLHQGFTFAQARAVVPYLARLGVSHLYASPYLKAAPGSTHGYDVVDHRALNPEVGTEAEHAALCDALARAGLGQVLDVVPNHMGIEHFNPLWWDVLENGPSSLYAKSFDIDWDPVKDELKDRVLLPILGDQYGVVLERGELQLEYAADVGALRVRYWETRLPVAPRQYGAVLGLDLARLEAELGAGHPELVELQSILTAVSHLPSRLETDAARRVERNREKEVVKRRLARLTQESAAVRAHVERNVATFNGTKGDPRSFDRLDALLEQCSYRLAYWRVAGEEINYRRFFDINGLAALRVEDPDVFADSHRLVFRWVSEGKLQGLRIDHPDGLFDPTAYFLALQEQHFVERARGAAGEGGLTPALEAGLRRRWRQEVEADVAHPLRKALWVAVEKIQGGKERIPEAWAVHGTVGYRFANALSGVFVDPRAAGALTGAYERFVGERVDFEELVYQKKLLILRVSLASELNVLARELNRISEMNRRTRDFTLNALRHALREFIAHFPVYRTYVDGWRPELDARDVEYVRWTVARAKARTPTTSPSIYDFLQDILLRRYPAHVSEGERAVMLRFAMKLQQLTGPVMAKGLEDTAFYIYNRLVSLNEVGGEPDHFGTAAEVFHQRNAERASDWPAAMLTSSTHDTKRSEDVRARLNVLSEVPGEWEARVRRWDAASRGFRRELEGGGSAPSDNDAYLFFQTLVGFWPMGDVGLSDEDRRRLREYMAKATKEAKVHTSWTNPTPAYDEGVAAFVDACTDPARAAELLADVRAFKLRIERAGRHNALGQVLLKLGSPGCADTYQGCELWDLSLVDPDNRRPVDYALRAQLLEALDAEAARDRAALARRLGEALADGADPGRAKLYLLAEGLRLRRRRERLFRTGGYRELGLEGPRAEAAVAFVREEREGGGGPGAPVVVLAPRFTLAALEAPGGLAAASAGTFLVLPPELSGVVFRDVLTGRTHTPQPSPGGGRGARLALDALLQDFPLALLEGAGEGQGG